MSLGKNSTIPGKYVMIITTKMDANKNGNKYFEASMIEQSAIPQLTKRRAPMGGVKPPIPNTITTIKPK